MGRGVDEACKLDGGNCRDRRTWQSGQPEEDLGPSPAHLAHDVTVLIVHALEPGLLARQCPTREDGFQVPGKTYNSDAKQTTLRQTWHLV